MKRSFAPEVDARTRLLVLGSLPGDRSLAEGRYYAHPSNQFWRLMGDVIGAPLDEMGYPARLSALRAAGVGLWDVIASASRAGSLDSAIRDERSNDLAALRAGTPQLQAIAFNGAAAARIGRKQLAGADVPLLSLPSSSAAYCRMSFEGKRLAWRALRSYL